MTPERSQRIQEVFAAALEREPAERTLFLDQEYSRDSDLRLAGTPFELTFYKSGDTIYGARSNEFGFANYQILPKGPANLVNLGKGESQEAHEAQAD